MNAIEQLRVQRNFRDVGYLAGLCPVPLKDGRLYRMGKLHGLTDEERREIEALHLTDIIDLRSASERIAQPDPPIAGVANHHIDFSAGRLGLDHVIALYRRAAEEAGSVDAKQYLARSYRALPELCVEEVRKVVSLITAKERPSVLIHCAGGKDRTGFLTALFLQTAGVDRETIIGDYLQSAKDRTLQEQVLERYLRRFKDQYGLDVPPHVAQPFLTVDRASIIEVLDVVEESYGGFTGYLRERVHCDSNTMDRLRSWLLTD